METGPGSAMEVAADTVTSRQTTLLTGNPLLNTALLLAAALVIIYIYRDAKARDMYPQLWVMALVIVVLFLPPVGIIIGMILGIIIYTITKPKGKLHFCPHCASPYFEHLMECPKCKGPLVRDCHRCSSVYPYESGSCPDCGAPN